MFGEEDPAVRLHDGLLVLDDEVSVGESLASRARPSVANLNAGYKGFYLLRTN